MSTAPAQAEPATAAPPREPRAWTSRRAWIILLLSLILGLAADLGTKAWAFRSIAGYPVEVRRDIVLEWSAIDPRVIGRNVIPPHAPVVVVPHVLNFTLVLNPGAVFGIGAGQRAFFVLFTAGAMAVALAVFAFGTRARDGWTHAALGLLLAGGLGNVYDRLAFGCVRDFIHPLPGVKFPFGWSPFGDNGEVWPYVSNVADALLLIGIGILAVRLWRAPKPDHPAPATAAS